MRQRHRDTGTEAQEQAQAQARGAQASGASGGGRLTAWFYAMSHGAGPWRGSTGQGQGQGTVDRGAIRGDETRSDVAYSRDSNHVPEHSVISMDWRMA